MSQFTNGICHEPKGQYYFYEGFTLMGEQECVLVWLNAGCVLHLQVADSIPAQVSGSQCVFCMCAGVIPHPLSLCSRIRSSFFPSEQPLLSLLSGNVRMDTATLPCPASLFHPPPFHPPLFIVIACSAIIFRVI